MIKLNSNYGNQRFWMRCRYTCWTTKTLSDRDMKIVNKSEKKNASSPSLLPLKTNLNNELHQGIWNFLDALVTQKKLQSNARSWLKDKKIARCFWSFVARSELSFSALWKEVSIVADNRDNLINIVEIKKPTLHLVPSLCFSECVDVCTF